MAVQATLKRRTLLAEGTWELDFDLGGARLEFAAGQHCRIELPTLDRQDRKNSRKFSIVNAPHDDAHVVVLTRAGITGYKCTLCALPPGAPACVRRVKGDLVLPEHRTRPLVLVAGGVGVAPFISMLRELDHREALDQVTMLYFNRSPASAAYLPELEELAARHAGFTLVLSMTRHPHWVGETARLSPALLHRVVPNPTAAEYYVVGTPAMVEAALGSLREAGVARKHVHDEDFSGYAAEPSAAATG